MVLITPRLFEVRFRKSTAGTRFYGSRQVSKLRNVSLKLKRSISAGFAQTEYQYLLSLLKVGLSYGINVNRETLNVCH